jgi:hypothetical protein
VGKALGPPPKSAAPPVEELGNTVKRPRPKPGS